MKGIRDGNLKNVGNAFLAITARPSLSFAAYGGFLLLDDRGEVVEAQVVRGPVLGGMCLTFADAVGCKPVDLAALKSEERLQQVTIPAIRARGAEQFVWLGPQEVVPSVSGDRACEPSPIGGFLYLFNAEDGRAPVFFPLAFSG